MQIFDQNEKPNVENKRYAPRWGAQAQCVCRMDKDNMPHEGQLKDVSCAGARVSTDQQLEINQNVDLTLFLSESGVVKVCGTVAWSEVVNSQKNVGIHFFNTSSEAQEAILQHAHSGNKKLLADCWFKGWEGA